MKPEDAEFLCKLQAAFRIEAEEHLQAISSGLLELEKLPEPDQRREFISVIFREAHSLKGAARAVNAEEIESICQSLENVLAGWRQNDVRVTPELFDPLHKALNAVARILPAPDSKTAELSAGETALLLEGLARLERGEAVAEGESKHVQPVPEIRKSPPPGPQRKPKRKPPSGTLSAPVLESSHVLTQLPSPASAAVLSAPTAVPAPRSGPASPPAPDTVRISTAKLDSLLLQAEEMLAVKLTAAQRVADLRQVLDTLSIWQRQWTKISPELRTPMAGLEGASKDQLRPALAQGTEFMQWSDEQIKRLQAQLSAVVKASDHDRRIVSVMVDTLLENAKNLLMLPCSTVFEAFPKMVRDLSRDQGKDIELIVGGGEVEIDKRVLTEMRDPLIHLLRNAVDHGIEEPPKRERAAKLARGTIHLAVTPVDGNKIEIVVSDDGGGIDPIQVKDAALRKGTISAEEVEALDDREALWLIFRPEVSTSPMITEISGRGLGLAIVKEKVERLGGRIELETRIAGGTTFRLQLPLTLATFRGLLVHCAGQPFVIPAANVERVLRVMPAEVQSVEMRETVSLNGTVISLVRLDDVLGLVRRPEPTATSSFPVAVLAAGERRIAFRVDSILNEQEVLVKRLGKPLSRVRNIAGATVLGSGKAVPILNADDLLKSAGKFGGRVVATSAATDATATAWHNSILVVEDSITARMLVKSILESAGYLVKTAVDGMDALMMLKTEVFDLVVSDVEMPRMNGFQLTEKIRADTRLTDLPVILVTALASREDRERGVDAGANAYIVKSSFDQGNLLDIVKRLL